MKVTFAYDGMSHEGDMMFHIVMQNFRSCEGRSRRSRVWPIKTICCRIITCPEFSINGHIVTLYLRGDDSSWDSKVLRVPPDYLGVFLELVADVNYGPDKGGNRRLPQLVAHLGEAFKDYNKRRLIC